MSNDSSIKSIEQKAWQDTQLRANQEALEAGEALPFPGVWDALDPTKLPKDATAEEIALRYRAFCKLCPPPKKIEYTI